MLSVIFPNAQALHMFFVSKLPSQSSGDQLLEFFYRLHRWRSRNRPRAWETLTSSPESPKVFNLASVQLGLLRIAQMLAPGFASLPEGADQIRSPAANGAVIFLWAASVR